MGVKVRRSGKNRGRENHNQDIFSKKTNLFPMKEKKRKKPAFLVAG